MWVKYKHKWSHGIDDDWTWEFIDNEFPSKGQVEEYVKEELAPRWTNTYEYSDHYRGVDFEFDEDVPLEVIKQHRDHARGRTQFWYGRGNEFDQMLEKFKTKCPTCRCRILPGEKCKCCAEADVPDLPDIDG
jgi:hypothetical protein